MNLKIWSMNKLFKITTHGTALVYKTLEEMKIGEKRFINPDCIVLASKNLAAITYEVSTRPSWDESNNVEVVRTSEESFSFSFLKSRSLLYNKNLSTDEIEKLQNDERIILFRLETETEPDEDHADEVLSRYTLYEQLNNVTAVEQYDYISDEDKKNLSNSINYLLIEIEAATNEDLDTLQNFKDVIKNKSVKDSIEQKIEQLKSDSKALSKHSLQELEEMLDAATEKEDYDGPLGAIALRNEINSRQKH